MSWLFDRMCDLAAADQLTVIVAADTATAPEEGDLISLAEVIRRASEIPQMTIWVIPAQHDDGDDLCRCG